MTEATDQHRATMAIAWEVIRDALHMPEDTTLARAGAGEWGGVLYLTVEHPDLPRSKSGLEPDVSPSVIHHRERFEWTWGPVEKSS